MRGADGHQAIEDYEKYGDIYVHVPNAVSISDPADVRGIYGSHSYRKADVYKAIEYQNISTTSSTRDPQFASMRRSNSYLAKMEQAILKHGYLAIKEKWDGLIEASKDGHVQLNYHRTFLFATFDTIGNLTFGKEFGSLKNDDPTVSKWLEGSMCFVWLQAMLMLIAGSETSSNTLMMSVHLLMLYPECYKRAVEEVRSAFDRSHVITFNEAKAKPPYLEACIYESLRGVPVIGGHWPRVAPKEGVSLRGHFVPGGTEININIPGANMNKKYWKDPCLFDPTRFLDNDEAKRSVFTFSTGVRVCPGKQLAWIEMFTILANVLKDYDLQLPGNYAECGPNVLDDRGYPKIMDTVFFISTMPKNSQRDCRIVISKRA
ncbi:hypothetical protein GGI12_004947 [Dipsacomyces acuminosporus]|nr:hypothetical protein GGI12_004947 [Dipsacomyces acuminosporus]